jgi:iron complex transport system substrate-binding protein
MKRIALFVVIVFIGQVRLVLSKTITDCLGNTLQLPKSVSRAFGTSPIVTLALYAVDPSLLVGLNFPIQELENAPHPAKTKEMPVLGGWFGNGRILNLEGLLAHNPQIVLSASMQGAMNLGPRDPAELFKRFGLPHAYSCLNGIQDYPGVFTWLGKVFGKEEKGNELSRFAYQALQEVQGVLERIPETERPTVYYAEGPDGLKTECDQSLHAWFIRFCGAENVHKCKPSSPIGMERVSLETLYLYDPEVILVQDSSFYAKIRRDPRWKVLKALKSGRVFWVPNAPFGWLDRPPLSFMGILGVVWLTSRLYPEYFYGTLAPTVQSFAEKFLHIHLNEEEALALMKP